MELRASDLESVLPEGHRARMMRGYVERQNLGGLYAGIEVVEGGVGRSAIAPEILFALWLYATLEWTILEITVVANSRHLKSTDAGVDMATGGSK